jgi:hypothetical protein
MVLVFSAAPCQTRTLVVDLAMRFTIGKKSKKTIWHRQQETMNHEPTTKNHELTRMDGRMNSDGDNLDRDEVARFAAQADKWWDLEGKYKALHEINPVRLAYVTAHAGLDGARVLDVGCGGGLLSEAMAAAGAMVTGIDMAAPSLEVAGAHARRPSSGPIAIPADTMWSPAWNWWNMCPIRTAWWPHVPGWCGPAAISSSPR